MKLFEITNEKNYINSVIVSEKLIYNLIYSSKLFLEIKKRFNFRSVLELVVTDLLL
jgi:hypothetical protein